MKDYLAIMKDYLAISQGAGCEENELNEEMAPDIRVNSYSSFNSQPEPIPKTTTADLPADPRQWPKDARTAFWDAVRFLNRTAKEHGGNVDGGRSPFAMADAERAVRESWEVN